MAQMLIAAFTDPSQATEAVDELESLGYNPKDISIISQENKTEKAHEIMGNPAEGAASGAATGGAIGGLAGLLAGAGVIPALAGLLIGGPIAVALGATGIVATTISGAVTGAVAGGLIGALTKLGVPEETAHYYDTTVKQGGIVLAVPVRSGDETEAKTVLTSHAAQQINQVDLTV